MEVKADLHSVIKWLRSRSGTVLFIKSNEGGINTLVHAICLLNKHSDFFLHLFYLSVWQNYCVQTLLRSYNIKETDCLKCFSKKKSSCKQLNSFE